MFEIEPMSSEDEPLMGHIFTTARKLAKDGGIDKNGYRLHFHFIDDSVTAGCVEIFVVPELLPDFQKFVIRQRENYF